MPVRALILMLALTAAIPAYPQSTTELDKLDGKFSRHFERVLPGGGAQAWGTSLERRKRTDPVLVERLRRRKGGRYAAPIRCRGAGNIAGVP